MPTGISPLDPPHRLLMGSGPSNPEPRVLRALAAAVLAPDDPTYASLLNDVTVLLRGVFCSPEYTGLAVPGASRAGIEAVLASLIEPRDRVVVPVYGHFGELLVRLASLHGADVERVDADWGSPVNVEAVTAAIMRTQPKLVAVVHADTSTGVLQPLEAIGRACREAGSLLVVDAVLSIGGCELRTAAWHIDAAIGGMQKCLGGPPGLAPVVLSDRAREAIAARSRPPESMYLDVARVARAWAEPSVRQNHGMPTPMLYALREALRIIDEEGLERRWRRHRMASRALVSGLQALGLELFGDRSAAVPSIALVRVPEGISEPGVREQLLYEHGVEIMAAFGPLHGKVWRIGVMGSNARLPSVLRVLSGLEAVLSARGWRVPRGAAVEAAIASYAPAG